MRLDILHKWVVMLLVISSSLTAQKSKIATDFADNGAELVNAGRYREALEKFESALNIYKSKRDWSQYAKCLILSSQAHTALSNPQASEAAIGEAFTVIENYLDANSLTLANGYDAQGLLLLEIASLDSVEVVFRKALDIRKTISGKSSPEVATSYYNLSQFYAESRQVDKQLEYLNKSLVIREKVFGLEHFKTAEVILLKGEYHYAVGEFEDARSNYESALEIFEKTVGEVHPKTAEAYLRLSSYYHTSSSSVEELEALEKAMDIQKELFGEENLDIADNYASIGRRYLGMGDFDNAITYYNKTINILQRIYGDDHKDVAYYYNFLARCFSKKDQQFDALYYLRKALKMQEKILPPMHEDYAETFNNLGNVYGDLKNFQLQLEYYEKALEIWRKKFGDEHFFIAIGYNNLGRAYSGFPDQQKKELFYLNKALELKTSKYGDTHPVLSRNYFNLGNYYQRLGKSSIALNNFQRSIMCSVKDFSDIDIYTNPELKNVNKLLQLLESLRAKAETLENRFEKKGNKRDLNFSFETYQLAIALIDTLRLDFEAKGSKQSLTRQSMPIYEGAINVAHELYAKTNDESYLNEAFVIMERSKAFLLLEGLKDSKAIGFGGVPDSLLVKEKRLKNVIALYQEQLFTAIQEEKKSTIAKIENTLFEKNAEYDLLTKLLEENYPEYYNIKYNNVVASVDEVQKQLLNKSAGFLEFFKGDTHVFAFFISKNNFTLRKFSRTDEFDSSILLLRKVLTDYEMILNDPGTMYEQFTTIASSLYKVLLEPELKSLPNLEKMIIVPDGILGYIPFEALLNPAELKDGVGFKQLPYLVKNYQFSYSYSGTLLMVNKDKQQSETNNRCLAFAPSYDNDRVASREIGNLAELKESNQALPGAQEEVKSLAGYYEGDFFFGDDATEEAFKDNASNYSIIHLAMHGLVDADNSMFSKLAFAETAKEEIEDGMLFAYEINNLDLNADLIVLSACETGYGEYVQGEGVMSLARGFLLAGVPSVVMTLWKVNDYSSSDLITLFYKELAEGEAKDLALQKAKLKYIENADNITAHPAYWAGFVTIGDTKPISSGNVYLLYAFGILGALIVVFLARKLLMQ